MQPAFLFLNVAANYSHSFTHFQLKSLKTTDNKSTLLHFVAGTLERKFPHVLEFAKDLSFTAAAARGSSHKKKVQLQILDKLFSSSSVWRNFGSGGE